MAGAICIDADKLHEKAGIELPTELYGSDIKG